MGQAQRGQSAGIRRTPNAPRSSEPTQAPLPPALEGSRTGRSLWSARHSRAFASAQSTRHSRAFRPLEWAPGDATARPDASRFCTRTLGPGSQQLDGILALVIIMFAKLIQPPALAFATTGMTPPQHFQMFVSFCSSLHLHAFRFGCLFAVRQRIPSWQLFDLLWVSFILRQRG